MSGEAWTRLTAACPSPGVQALSLKTTGWNDVWAPLDTSPVAVTVSTSRGSTVRFPSKTTAAGLSVALIVTLYVPAVRFMYSVASPNETFDTSVSLSTVTLTAGASGDVWTTRR